MQSGPEYLDTILDCLRRGQRQWKRGDNVLAAFGYTRRRQSAIDWINNELEARGMFTTPELTTSMPLDSAIHFRLKNAGAEEPDSASLDTGDDVDDEPLDTNDPTERSLIVGNLECADHGAVCVTPNATILEALTKMDANDFSQLVVVSGPRDVRGVVSFKSITRASLHGKPTFVHECIDSTVPRVELTKPLLEVVDLFRDHDIVLVMKADKGLSGLVTPTDIAAEFQSMTGPFLLIGFIEERLRWLIRRAHLPPATATYPDSDPADFPSHLSDLTMGDLQRILENPEHWARVGIQYDRKTFCGEMNSVREIRNAVMHFRDTPVDGLDQLRRFATLVQRAYSAVSTQE